MAARETRVDRECPTSCMLESCSKSSNSDVDVHAHSEYSPRSILLKDSSSGFTMTFYVYRAQSGRAYPPENVNAASLGGVLWYMHNEVVTHCPRKFGISRLLRYKVTMRATAPLLAKGMNFGVLYSFDSGRNSGPCNWHGEEWDRYGYFVGCAYLGKYPHQDFHSAYPDSIWYSLPGPCPQSRIGSKSSSCERKFPGGLCSSPTGAGDCTYSYEEAGNVDFDEVVGIKPKWRNNAAFCRSGCREYGGGHQCISFWRNKESRSSGKRRMNRVLDAFAEKYPDMPRDLPPPPCDFDMKEFYPSGRHC
eukprot:TRINITY_DN14149_c0_g2_i1.p2 TRINITY_DN14149_c0_g2~~TRINITY_DN14149_c0_g2_i1.p2  ORF type:complete len:305 (-),score=60.45 TRINITY_DN14149_c0_g2_i1:232-1146(-)